MDSSSSFPPPGVETRLMITKIVCKDFKSYAGVKELGPFHKVSVFRYWKGQKFNVNYLPCSILPTTILGLPINLPESAEYYK